MKTASFIGIVFIFLMFSDTSAATEFLQSSIRKDIVYSGPNTADNSHKLDIYSPEHQNKLTPALIWFHGGGLTSGSKNQPTDVKIANFWQSQGITLVNVDYRLAPQVKFPAYIEDAAQAVAWVQKNARKIGVDPQQIYVGGHSAGAYLTTMLAMDEHYLRAHNIDPKSIAGFISLSGQMTTHFTVRKERGLSDLPIIVDDAAPSFFVRADIPRLLLLIGDYDWPARLEENQLLFAQFTQIAKTDKASFHIIPNRDHSSIYEKISEPGDETEKVIAAFMSLK